MTVGLITGLVQVMGASSVLERCWHQAGRKDDSSQDGMTHDGDDGSTYVAGMFAVCGGADIMDQKLRQLLMMILVDGYQDGMLSRTTTISGGGGCKDLRFLACPLDVRRFD